MLLEVEMNGTIKLSKRYKCHYTMGYLGSRLPISEMNFMDSILIISVITQIELLGSNTGFNTFEEEYVS